MAKTVTVTAVDDAVAEGAHTGTITHTPSGGGYAGVAVANVVVDVTDNDTRGVTIVLPGSPPGGGMGRALHHHQLERGDRESGVEPFPLGHVRHPDGGIAVNAPFERPHESQEGLQKGGLAAAIGSDDAEDLAVVDVERQAPDQHPGAIAQTEVLRLHQRHGTNDLRDAQRATGAIVSGS